MNTFQGISQRFASTISQVDLVVDARTGKAVGIATNVEDAKKKKKPIKKRSDWIADGYSKSDIDDFAKDGMVEDEGSNKKEEEKEKKEGEETDKKAEEAKDAKKSP